MKTEGMSEKFEGGYENKLAELPTLNITLQAKKHYNK